MARELLAPLSNIDFPIASRLGVNKRIPGSRGLGLANYASTSRFILSPSPEKRTSLRPFINTAFLRNFPHDGRVNGAWKRREGFVSSSHASLSLSLSRKWKWNWLLCPGFVLAVILRLALKAPGAILRHYTSERQIKNDEVWYEFIKKTRRAYPRNSQKYDIVPRRSYSWFFVSKQESFSSPTRLGYYSAYFRDIQIQYYHHHSMQFTGHWTANCLILWGQ